MFNANQLLKSCALGFLTFVSATAYSLEAKPEVAKKITDKLQAAQPGIEVSSVKPSPVAGVYEVRMNGNNVLYVTESADFFFHGDIYKINSSGLVNLTEQDRNHDRAELMADVKRDNMIIFSPKGEVKGRIAVFTDVDCGYCQKLHQEVPRLNELGIEVQYLAYPRAGVGSNSYKKIASAWCAKDKRDSLTKLKNREPIPNNVCENNPVENQLELGNKVGVTGTPALVLESGELVPGYLPADRLAAKLGIK